MKRHLFFISAIIFCGLTSLRADEAVRAAQTRLKEDGFYFGDATGVYDSATAAGVTRYQIRNGLAISGKLDAATAHALGVAPPKSTNSGPAPTSDTWRTLRNSDQQFLERLNSGAIPPPRAGPEPSPQRSSTARVAPPNEKRTATKRQGSPEDVRMERLRDYVGAFVLAGLDPQVGAELEFFGRRVNYFGEANIDRAKIRRDLVRYDREWPDRRFWLAGELQVEHQAADRLKVTFPLRYELRNGAKHVSGEVLKSLTLQTSGHDNLEIVAVSEQKVRPKRKG